MTPKSVLVGVIFLFKGKERKGIYDFYFKLKDGCEYIVEMDGSQHYRNKSFSNLSIEEINYIDTQKDKLANENNIDPIRINCEVSSCQHIMKYVLQSRLAKLFDLSVINWSECEKYASSSLLFESCKLWGKNYSIKEICEVLRVSDSTVRVYLKRGKHIGLCDYDPKEEIEKNNKLSHSPTKKIICKDTMKVFDSVKEGASFYNITPSTISDHIHGKSKSAGKSTDGNPLHWHLFSDYILNNNYIETIRKE